MTKVKQYSRGSGGVFSGGGAALLLLVACGLLLLVACGDGASSTPDASNADAPVTLGTVSLSWSIADLQSNALACDDVAALTVTVTATPSAGGFAVVDTFTCGAGSATSRAIEPNSYNIGIRLSTTAGVLAEAPVMRNVEVVAGQDVALGDIAFAVEPLGSLSFQINTGAAGANCADLASAGGELTELFIELHDEDDICIPTTFNLDDGTNPGPADYVSDCAGASTPCVDESVVFTAADVSSGKQTLVIRGLKGTLECYSLVSQFVTPGNKLSRSLGSLLLSLMNTLECDPNAPDAGPVDAMTPVDAT